MKVKKLADMKSGWFVGGFEPSAYHSKDVEVNYRIHKKGEFWDKHYHTVVTEVNLLIRGKMLMQNKELNSGDIFIIEPWEIANPEFLEDCEVICVKFPSANDKRIIKEND